jgi:hypothetical protein
MRESKRSHHKRRKWICPVCGRAQMENRKPRARDRRAPDKGRH